MHLPSHMLQARLAANIATSTGINLNASPPKLHFFKLHWLQQVQDHPNHPAGSLKPTELSIWSDCMTGILGLL